MTIVIYDIYQAGEDDIAEEATKLRQEAHVLMSRNTLPEALDKLKKARALASDSLASRLDADDNTIGSYIEDDAHIASLILVESNEVTLDGLSSEDKRKTLIRVGLAAELERKLSEANIPNCSVGNGTQLFDRIYVYNSGMSDDIRAKIIASGLLTPLREAGVKRVNFKGDNYRGTLVF